MFGPRNRGKWSLISWIEKRDEKNNKNKKHREREKEREREIVR